MINLYALPRTDFFRGPEIHMGDTVWFAFDHHYVVQCRLRDVDFYCSYPERPDDPGFWTGCSDFWDTPDEKFVGAARCSQWLWIDEPVGHSVQIWSPETHDFVPSYGDAFLTLDHALQVVAPRRKSRRRAQSALHRYRRDQVRFIRSTGNLGVNLALYPDKPVYCRKR